MRTDIESDPALYVTMTQASRLLGVNEGTLSKWGSYKRLKVVRFGHRLRIPISEVERIKKLRRAREDARRDMRGFMHGDGGNWWEERG